MISLSSRVSPSPNQISTDVAGDVVLLNLQSGVYHGLSDVGAAVWKRLESEPPVPAAALRDAVLADYEVPPEQCERDVLNLLEELHVHGLIDVAHDTVA